MIFKISSIIELYQQTQLIFTLNLRWHLHVGPYSGKSKYDDVLKTYTLNKPYTSKMILNQNVQLA